MERNVPFAPDYIDRPINRAHTVTRFQSAGRRLTLGMPMDTTLVQQHLTEACGKMGRQACSIIECLNNPQKVIALPGLDTVNLLSLRLCHILLQPGINSSEILCLTTTDTFAADIRQQLERLTGQALPSVTILSAAAFAEKLLLEQPFMLEGNPQSKISTLEIIQLLKQLIDQFPKDHPLKSYRGDLYRDMNLLKKIFSAIKTQHPNLELLLREIDSLLDKDPDRENPPSIRKLRACICEFQHYNHMLEIRQQYDPDDIIPIVNNALQANIGYSQAYLQRYRYVHVAVETPLHGATAILLKWIVRICGRANFLWVENATLNSDAMAQAQNESLHIFNGFPPIRLAPAVPVNIPKPTVVAYKSVAEEYAAITNTIYELLQQGLDPGGLAIVYPNNTCGECLEQYLQLKSIPFHSRRKTNLLQQPFIQKIIQLLRYLDKEYRHPFSADEGFFEILHADFFKVPPLEIARLATASHQKKVGGISMGMRSLLRTAVMAPPKDLFDPGPDKALSGISSFVEQLIDAIPKLSLQQLFNQVLKDAHIWQYIEASPEKDRLKYLLGRLEDFILQETNRNPELGLTELIVVWDIMQQAKIPVLVEANINQYNGVALVAAAELPVVNCNHVFIVGANKAKQEERDLCFSFDEGEHPSLAFLNILGETQEAALARHFYEQMNRGAQVWVSFARFNIAGVSLQVAPFLNSPLLKETMTLEPAQLPAAMSDEYQSLCQLKPTIPPLPTYFTRPLLAKFVMNVSALNAYLACPLSFYYQYILRIPRAISEAMEFGSAIHYALEQLFRKMAAGYVTAGNEHLQAWGQNEFPPDSELIADFNSYMHRRANRFTPEAFNRRTAYGEDVLINYYHHYIHTWNKVISVERNIRVLWNGIPLRGKPDKLEFDGRSVTIVDYKTGDIKKSLEKLQPPGDTDPNGGGYWRQAVFYKLLIDHYPQKDWRVARVVFDFVEPDEHDKYHQENIWITPADTTTVQQQIARAWSAIQAHDFYTGCGDTHCHWCNFVKQNKLGTLA